VVQDGSLETPFREKTKFSPLLPNKPYGWYGLMLVETTERSMLTGRSGLPEEAVALPVEIRVNPTCGWVKN